jgi:hypothetical protein
VAFADTQAKLTCIVSVNGVDLRGHLIGAQAIMQASQGQSPSGQASRFRQACLWSAFRQELYIGLKEHRPVRCQPPQPCSRETIHDDWDWALYSVSTCAEVVNCVFGKEIHTDLIRLLNDQVCSWQAQGSKSFQPLGTAPDLNKSASEFLCLPLLAPCHGKPSNKMSVLTSPTG